MNKYIPLLFLAILASPPNSAAQEISDERITRYIVDFKNDPRGPYHRIRWYCEDGSIREPRDPCPDSIGGGIQHASYKQIVKDLQEKNHIFFGDILAHTEIDKFWDAPNNHNRLKQYQLGKYLAGIDDGWILRKAQYYRGAVQSEDEKAWGVQFFQDILAEDKHIQENYYLLRQAIKDIPHGSDTDLAQDMRSQSKNLADDYPEFMDARIKIHGQPDRSDIRLVGNFIRDHQSRMTNDQMQEASALLKTLKEYYAPIDFNKLKNQLKNLTGDDVFDKWLIHAFDNMSRLDNPKDLVTQLADILCEIREGISRVEDGNNRLVLLDLSVELENILLKKSQEWNPESIRGLIDKIYVLSLASMGTGLIETNEWAAVKNHLLVAEETEQLSIDELNSFLKSARNVVEWSAGMVKAAYGDVVERYSRFEPMAYGFIDDRIRNSISLSLGESVSILGDILARESSISNKVLGIQGQHTIRGLNPGYALGELVVVDDNAHNFDVDSDKIYIFQKPPSDLKPVAGIMTVSEGNLVSHVQLLARNLGIPNAALSDKNLRDLMSYQGKEIFYAVTSAGNVVMKPGNEMNPREKALFTSEEHNKKKITVPTDQIKIEVREILDMRDVDSDDSGKLCGPKAANLGELKKMFPEHVVEGLIIPFGIFKTHMDQPMPGTGGSYWEFLSQTFKEAENMRSSGVNVSEIDSYQLSQLAVLRDAIKRMDLNADFVAGLRKMFKKIFNGKLGEVPVFLRSDTNMEDLEEFTGAGLNLTVFNVVEEGKIIQGIKDVWASPYTERSFKWRQSYLLNPENVFPSILIIPSVDVDYSGVMITKGINAGSEKDITVAFSRGAGGAVDGQSAETYLISQYGHRLLSPSRQADYIRLPSTGGVKKYYQSFNNPILSDKNIRQLRDLAREVRETVPVRTGYSGPYDVELGFKEDKIWLFQIRPFVENDNARTSEYLNSITPQINGDKKVSLNTAI